MPYHLQTHRRKPRHPNLPSCKCHTRLAIKLQRLESDMILRTICKRIISEKPDIPIFTIHDSIMTTDENVNYVKQVMIEEFANRFGIVPSFKIEK